MRLQRPLYHKLMQKSSFYVTNKIIKDHIQLDGASNIKKIPEKR